tara:strand:+ start:387 stop:1352 length:966 start_codon:yes stop_codon:yes gene_type:complete
MKKVTVVFLTLIFLWSASAEKATKVVFLHGGRSHASGDHEFKAGSHLLAKHLNKQSAVSVKAIVNAGWPKDESIIDDADAIVIYADGTSVIGKGWEKMDQLVKKNKVGVVFMHYAVHPAVEQGEKYYLPWIGGYFKNGISVNPFWRADIQPMKGHETARGVGPIDAVDEFYFNIHYHPEALFLGTATPNEKNLHHINNIWTRAAYLAKGKKQSLLWGIVRPGGGRGAGFTGGHHHRNWAIDGYRQLILNTIVWATGQEVPRGGVPTYAVTEDELNEQLDDYGSRTNRIKLPTKSDVTFTPGPWMTPEEHAESRRKPKKKKK